MARTKKAEEIERAVALLEPLLCSLEKDDKAALCFILGAMMSGSCTKKQQTKNTRSLRIFYEALQNLEEKNSKTYEYTSIVADYLGVNNR